MTRILAASAIVASCWVASWAVPPAIESLVTPGVHSGFDREGNLFLSFEREVPGAAGGGTVLPEIVSKEPLTARQRVEALGYAHDQVASAAISWIWKVGGIRWVEHFVRWKLSRGVRVWIAAPRFTADSPIMIRNRSFSVLTFDGQGPKGLLSLPQASDLLEVSSGDLVFSNALGLTQVFGVSGWSSEVKAWLARDTRGTAIFYPTRFGMLWAYCSRKPGEACTNRVDKLLKPDERVSFLRLKKSILAARAPTPSDVDRVLSGVSALGAGVLSDELIALPLHELDPSTRVRLDLELLRYCANAAPPSPKLDGLLRKLIFVESGWYTLAEPELGPSLANCAAKLGDRELGWHAEFIRNNVRYRKLMLPPVVAK